MSIEIAPVVIVVLALVFLISLALVRGYRPTLRSGVFSFSVEPPEQDQNEKNKVPENQPDGSDMVKSDEAQIKEAHAEKTGSFSNQDSTSKGESSCQATKGQILRNAGTGHESP